MIENEKTLGDLWHSELDKILSVLSVESCPNDSVYLNELWAAFKCLKDGFPDQKIEVVEITSPPIDDFHSIIRGLACMISSDRKISSFTESLLIVNDLLYKMMNKSKPKGDWPSFIYTWAGVRPRLISVRNLLLATEKEESDDGTLEYELSVETEIQ